MARFLICGFEAFPAAPRNPAAAAVEILRRDDWRPAGGQTEFATLPVSWRRSTEHVLARLTTGRFDGVLLVGVAVDEVMFRVEAVARNRAATAKVDHDAAAWPFDTVDAEGPGSLPATAPCQSMLTALSAQALPARLSEDAGDYLCNFTLYRVLRAAPSIPVGFLHVPQARECAAGAAFDLSDIVAAIRACAGALAEGVRHPVV